jgi:predicted phosphodiesterase
MRILHCSDFHANDRWFRWLIEASLRYDLVCLAGDLMDLNPYRSIDGRLERIAGYLKAIEAPLALCSGNHDSQAGSGPRLEHATWLQELRGEKCWVDGDRFELGGYRFRCIPWLSQEIEAGPDEIWVIHAPPDQTKTGITRGGIDFGDFTFGEQCRNGLGPRLALSGHVHDPKSWRAKVKRTWSLNPGCQEQGNPPRYIEIDLGKARAIWRGSEGRTEPVFFK